MRPHFRPSRALAIWLSASGAAWGQPASPSTDAAPAASASTPAEAAPPETTDANAPATAAPASDEPPPLIDPVASGASSPAPPATEAQAASESGTDETGGYGHDPRLPPTAGQLRDEEEDEGRISRVYLSYSTAMPAGAIFDFASNFSFLGLGVDWRLQVEERVSAGVSLGWQVFYSKDQRTSELGDVTLSGVQVRHVNAFPILAAVRFSPRKSSAQVQPFLGAGLGVYVAEWRVDVGLSTLSRVSAHFGFSPELGLLFHRRRGELVLGVKYNYGFESGGNPELSYFAFTFGGRI